MLDHKLTWKITIENMGKNTNDKLQLEFIDTTSILGEPTIENEYINSIHNLTQQQKHYSLFNNLCKIISDTGEDVSADAIWALLGVVKESKQRIGFLLGALSERMIHIIAVWPNFFADELRTQPKLFEEVLENFVSKPEFWKQVDLVIKYPDE